MRSSRIRRVGSLAAAVMAFALAASPGLAPAVSADDNVAPTVTAHALSSTITEPMVASVMATFTDPESATETYTCAIDFGDGTAPVAVAVSGLTCAGPDHHYTVGGNYTVTVTITDSGGASGASSVTVTYLNSAPYVGPTTLFGTPSTGQTLHVSVPFLDPGSTYSGAAFETYVCKFNYGDGSGIQIGTYLLLWSASGTPGCIGPDHVYSTPGTYTITSVVTDGGGLSGSSSLIQTIAQNMSPIVTSPADQTVQGVPGAPAQVSLGSFTDPGGASAGPWSISVIWGDDPLAGWGSGGTAKTQGPISGSHAYAPGTWHLQIKVTNAAGKFGYAYANVTVLDGIAVVLAAPGQPVTEGVASTFGVFVAAFGARSLPYQVHMDWGDGTSSDLSTSYDIPPATLTHTYAAADPTTPGVPVTVYTATATVKDGQGRTASASMQVGVGDVAPRISAPSYIPVAEGPVSTVTLATFTDASLGPWHVRIDGGPGLQRDEDVAAPGPIQLAYDPTSGNRTFTIMVGDRGGLISTVTVPVTVENVVPSVGPIDLEGDVANGQPIEGGSVIASATFTDPGSSSSPPESFTCAVDYGDGSGVQVGTIEAGVCRGPVHTYGSASSGTIWIKVTDSNLGYRSVSRAYALVNLAPTVAASAIQSYGPAGVSTAAVVTFTDPGLVAGGAETYTCTIDYGDGAGPQASVVNGSYCTGPSHAYASKGTYTLAAVVTDSNGGVGTYSLLITTYNPSPIVGAVTAPDTVILGTSASASADVTTTGFDPPDTCTVDYDDGTGPLPGVITGSTCQGPSHLYGAAGYHLVTVRMASALGTYASGSTMVRVMTPVPQVGPVTAPGEVNEGSSVTASAQFTIVDNQKYTCTVNYGDGSGAHAGVISGSICKGSSHKYTRPGDLTVTVAVRSSTTGLTGTSSKEIIVSNVAPKMTSYSITPFGKVGSTISASIAFTDPGSTETYTVIFDWGDGTSTTVKLGSAARSASSKHVYKKAGVYTMSMTLSDGPATNVPAWAEIGIYDAARTSSGSGSVTAPAGSCLLSSKCAVASKADFSMSAKYAGGATKPTVSFSYSAIGFYFASTGADWFAAANGIAAIRGTGKVNGVAGYTYRLTGFVGKPSSMQLLVWNSAGTLVYDLEPAPLNSGSITIK